MYDSKSNSFLTDIVNYRVNTVRVTINGNSNVGHRPLWCRVDLAVVTSFLYVC